MTAKASKRSAKAKATKPARPKPSALGAPLSLSAKAPPRDLKGFTFVADGREVAVLSFARDAPALLTTAEREVAFLILAGRTNADIAQVRGTSMRTVANQVASLFRKLEVSSRAELVAAAERVGRS